MLDGCSDMTVAAHPKPDEAATAVVLSLADDVPTNRDCRQPVSGKSRRMRRTPAHSDCRW